MCVLYRQWLALVPNTGHSQDFIFAWLSEQRRTPQLSSSGLRSTSCGVAALRVYDVMRVGHNLGIVYCTISTVEAQNFFRDQGLGISPGSEYLNLNYI